MSILELMLTDSPKDRHLLVRKRGRIVVVDLNEVDWFGAEGDNVRLQTAGRRHLVRHTMAAMEARLDPNQFLRIHRSAIVNVSRVREIRQHGRDYTVVLRDGTRLKMSRGNRARLYALVAPRK